MAYSAQTKVPRTSKISSEASRLFLSPNCRGVKKKLKSRFKAKGKATIHGICLVKAL